MGKLRLFGLSFLALVALGALGSVSAWASGAPENTARPEIYVSAPKVGTVEAATKGTWTNSPTAYAYQWQRCNASGGECINIPGATSKGIYEVTEADAGHTLVFKVTASNAAGEGVATSPATAVVPKPLHPEIVPAPTETNPLNFEATTERFGFERANKFEYFCHAVLTGHFINAFEARQVKISYSNCFNGYVWTTEYLKAKLGYISVSAHTVALELTPEVGSLFIKSWINGAPMEGSSFGLVKNINQKTNKFELEYTSREGSQTIQGFEGATGTHLTWTSLKESVAMISSRPDPLVLNTAREVEIKG